MSPPGRKQTKSPHSWAPIEKPERGALGSELHVRCLGWFSFEKVAAVPLNSATVSQLNSCNEGGGHHLTQETQRRGGLLVAHSTLRA